MFISIEGIDGSGKTTLAEGIASRLGPRALVTREPWNEDIRGILVPFMMRARPGNEALAEFFLFCADRALHVVEIERGLAEGRTVISDRYLDSSVAYQGPRLGLDFDEAVEWMLEVSRFFPLPDMTILLDAEPEVALSRIAGRERRYGFEEVRFLSTVRDWYLRLARRFPQRIRIIDARRGKEEVLREALRILGEREHG